VAETLRLFASFARQPLDAETLLDRLDLRRVSGTPWRRLSGGEQQRLSLALALVGRPELVFLDEPTAGLDVHTRLSVWELLDELRRAGVTVVLTTHTMDEAERLADHVVVLADGRTVATGSVAQLAEPDQARLTFDARPGLPVATLAATLPTTLTVAEPRPGHYVVVGTDAAAIDATLVARVAAWCAEHGALPDHLETHRQRLEDVFLELTRDRA
jgi:ABC-2 type transport system ATP-binding protein